MYKRSSAPISASSDSLKTMDQDVEAAINEFPTILSGIPAKLKTQPLEVRSSSESSLKPSNLKKLESKQRLWELFIGIAGIYSAYLYYGITQEDLFRWRSTTGDAFTYVWFLQVFESAVTICIGFLGRTRRKLDTKPLPMVPFFKSGFFQLAGKVLMSWSLAAGLSFPVVTLAKSAKIVPVMIGQLALGGSSYKLKDYLFAVLIVSGTALVSAGSTTHHFTQRNTFAGVVLICLSLTADGFTGGLQKRLKKETSAWNPNNFDYLLYSHLAQLVVAVSVCLATSEWYHATVFLVRYPNVIWYLLASCCCSAIGQSFIFYVIAKFDPLVCTTITTTRKLISVILSVTFKGHTLDESGILGLGLAFLALGIELEAKLNQFRRKH